MCKYCDNIPFVFDNFNDDINLSEEFKEYAAEWAWLHMYRYGYSPKYLEKNHIEFPLIYSDDFIKEEKSHPLYGKVVLSYMGDDEGYVPIDYCPFCGKKLV